MAGSASGARGPDWDDLVHGSLTDATIGAGFEVHNTLGSGFLESVYASSLAVELHKRGFRVARNVLFEVLYRSMSVGRYVADLIVDEKVLVEVKVAKSIEAVHRGQLLNYLRASGLEVGLVVNFGSSLTFKRVVWTSVAAGRGRISDRLVSDADRPPAEAGERSKDNGNGNT